MPTYKDNRNETGGAITIDSEKLCLLAFTASTCLTASAQTDYPSKSITIVIAYSLRGTTDLAGGVVPDILAKQLKVITVVKNIGGAGGTIGVQKVVNATPDGYTLLLGVNNEVAINKLINSNLRYYGAQVFAPIGLVASQPMALGASVKTGIKNTDDSISL